MKLNYCKKCLFPETKPDLYFEDGICQACINAEKKDTTIDWDKRKKDFEQLIKKFRKKGLGYDCLIPVSG